MRIRREFKIDNLELVAKELTMEEILGLLQDKQLGKGLSLETIEESFNTYAPKFVDGITYEQLRKLAPSEIKEIIGKIQEANEVFFDIAGRLGLKEIGSRLKEQFLLLITEDFGKFVADSLKQDTSES